MSPENLFDHVGVKDDPELSEKEKKMAKVKRNIGRKELWESLSK